MPLRDHFHPPVRHQCAWESFHSHWTAKIVDRLNETILPEPYAARPLIHAGPEVQVDVAALETPLLNSAADGQSGNGATTAVKVWAPPQPPISGSVSFVEPDLFEVQIVQQPLGNKLVAAIELVSPANKDRPEHRETFAIKCASYLAKGVAVVVVDVVTERHANLHNQLVELLKLTEQFPWESPSRLAAVAYRMVRVKDFDRLDVWPFPLAIGAELPTVPLWVAADIAVPLELEWTYTATWKTLRIR